MRTNISISPFAPVMFPPSLLISLFLLYQTIQASPSPYWTFESKCDAFTLPPSFNNATFTVNVRKFIPANTTLLLSGNDASCNRGSQLVAVDLCRIALKIETSNTSGIVAELWLPEIWEGRVLGVGNGGIDGCEWDISPSGWGGTRRGGMTLRETTLILTRYQVRRHCVWGHERVCDCRRE